MDGGDHTTIDSLSHHVQEFRRIYGVTLAWIAASRGHAQIIQLLLDAGVNLQISNKDGATPAFAAAEENHVKVLELLRDANLNLDASDEDGRTRLQWLQI